MKKVIISVILCFLMFGCSIPGYIYIRNYNRQSVNILVLKNKYTDRYLRESGTGLRYNSEIIPIRVNLYKSLKDSIQPVVNNQTLLEYILPAHSTAYFGMGLNGRIGFADGFVIKKATSADTITAAKFNSKFLFLYGVQACYDIK